MPEQRLPNPGGDNAVTSRKGKLALLERRIRRASADYDPDLVSQLEEERDELRDAEDHALP